jgi:20S proteasome alpha/beta subunit
MKLINLALPALIAISGAANSAQEKVLKISTNDISALRSHSASHHVVGAQNVTMMWLPNLFNGCSTVFLYGDQDPFLYATVLAGVNKSTPVDVTVIYDVDSKGSWDQTSCKLTSFTIHK